MAAGESALLAFRIADRRFALDAARVAEVVRPPPVTRVPHAPPSLAGVAALRGRVLPVISMAELLGVEGRGVLGRLIVLGGSEPIGLAVDEVLGLEAGDGGGLVETQDGAVARVLPLEDMLARAFERGFRRTGVRGAAQAAPQAAAAETVATVSLLAFSLAGQPYALPLADVREVIAPPAEVVGLPRTDAAMLGVAALRGALIPIVSARVLLGLTPAPLSPSDRVIVANVAGARIGFAVDHVAEIVHAPETAIGPVPSILNRGAGEARVTAMLRVEGGGLISVLDPERLFAEESVAHILEDGRGAPAAPETERGTQAFQRFLIFQLGDETYGLDIGAVEEVTAMPEQLSRVPKAPAYVLGVMPLRGRAVPVIDQRRRFGLSDFAGSARPRVIVTQVGDLVAGFAVDAVTEILELPAERLSATPELTQDAARLFDRVARTLDDGRVILLVNPQELLDRAERDLLSALAADAATG